MKWTIERVKYGVEPMGSLFCGFSGGYKATARIAGGIVGIAAMTKPEMFRKIADIAEQAPTATDKDLTGEPPTAPTAPKCVECEEYSKTIYHRCLRDGYACVPLIDDPEDLKNLKQGGCPKAPKPSQAATTGIFQGKTADVYDAVYDAVKAASVPPVSMGGFPMSGEISIKGKFDENGMFQPDYEELRQDAVNGIKRPTADAICKGTAGVQGKRPESPRVKQNIKPVKAITVKCQESGVRECLSALSEANDDRQADNNLLADHVNTIFGRLDALETWKSKANDALVAVDNNQIADRETVEKWSKELAAKQHGLIVEAEAKLTEFQTNIDALFACQTVAVKEIKDLQAENKTNEEHLKIDKDTIFGLLEKHSRRLDAIEKRLLGVEKRPIAKSARILRKLHEQAETMKELRAEIDEIKGKVKK